MRLRSYFRSFRIVVVLILIVVMVGCSTYSSIERSASSSTISSTTENSKGTIKQVFEDQNEDHNFSVFDRINVIEQGDGKTEQKDQANTQINEDEQQVMKIAITFDDGPDLKYTPRILDILKEKNVKATFFVVGMQVNKHPEVLKRIDAEGHLIGNHTYYHPNLKKLSYDELISEITKTDEKINELTGKIPSFVRPPYGAVNDDVKQQLMEMDKKVVLWNIDPRDWDGTSVDDMFENIIDNARNGGNILLHSFGSKHIENTVKLLPLVIEKLRLEGYTFVTVDEL